MDSLVEYIVYIAQNFGVVMLVMIALIELILWGIKKPIKLLTNKIKNERVRKLANKVFILLSFGLAFGLYYLGKWLLPSLVPYEYEEIGKVIATGAFAVVIYAFGDGVVTLKKPAEVANIAAQISAVVNDAKEDGKIDNTAQAVSAVDSFKNLCNSINESEK